MNKYFEDVISNNKKFLSELERTINENLKNSNTYYELQNNINSNSSFTSLNAKFNTLGFYCKDCDYSEYLDDSIDFFMAPFVYYKIDFKNKTYTLDFISFPDNFFYIILDKNKTSIYGEIEDSFNSNPRLCLEFSHENNISVLNGCDQHFNCLTCIFSKNTYNFYELMYNLSKENPLDIYEYIFLDKKLKKEYNDFITLSTDININETFFNEFRFKLNEVNLDYKKNSKQEIKNKPF